ncbi:MAG: transposase, partial [Aestuariivita sp.]|nr:transposase [Aestuariivita sp.]
GHVDPSKERFKQRSRVERVNAALKDSYGGRHLRVRGAAKVACHLFFGIFALTVDQ